MVNNKSTVLMITEEDIEQLLTQWNSVPAWVKAHLSARCPAHRYEGELLLDDENLVFGGRDIKEGKYFELEIPLENITDIHVGFSEHLKASIDPAFGIGGPLPFVVGYQDNGQSQTAYFTTTGDNYPAHRNINNLRWYETLSETVTEHRRLKLAGMSRRDLVRA